MRSSLNTKGRSNASGAGKRKRNAGYRYVYCIIPPDACNELQITGIEGEDVRVIGRSGIAAVVSDTAEQDHEILDGGIFHQRVVEEVQRHSAVLPMGFGQVSTDHEIMNFLERNRYRLGMMLDQFAGMRELVVKASWKMDAILKEISTSDDRVRVMKNQVSSKSGIQAHKMKIKMGQKIADTLDKHGEKVSGEFLSRLEPLCEKRKINKNASKEMFFNAAFLVTGEKEGEFDAAVDELDRKYGETINMNYVVSPPYDFVSLRIR